MKQIVKSVAKGVLGLALVAASMLAGGSLLADPTQAHSHSQPQSGSNGKMQTYSCDLRQLASQCRQYTLAMDALENLADLGRGCKSMGGRFTKKACPATDVASLCRNIMRDPHKGDIVYDNHYYRDVAARWSDTTVQEICSNLRGEYDKPE